ncbi:MAG: amino acid permease [Chlorobium sp.]|uniref:APC family permease n=1 Tax=Chlorobium sp. TaxID=1095 RepID=UPI002F41D45F
MKNSFTGGLKREIALPAAIVLVIANMIGTGVFTSSGFILGEVGSPQALLACWVIGGLFALAGALCYGELGAMLPHAGGEYIYLRRSFGALPGFVSGWISLIVGFSAPIAAASIAFATYLLGGGDEPLFVIDLFDFRLLGISPVSVLAIAAIVTFSLVHYHSLHLGQRVQNFLTAFKIAFILLFVVAGFGLGQGDPSRLALLSAGEGDAMPWGDFAVALIFVSFAYSGWNATAYLGGEIKNPERTLPLALLIGTAIVTLLYMLLNLLYLYALPPERMTGLLEVGLGAATALFGKGIGSFFGMAIAFGLLSVVSAMIMTGSRVYYAMARDGLFFSTFGQVDAVHHTPAYSIFFQAAIAIVMVLTAAFEVLLVYIGFTLSLSAMLTVLGLMRLRLKEPDLPRPYRTFGYPFTPLLFIAGNLWVVVFTISSRPLVGAAGVLTIGIGVALYFLLNKQSDDSVASCCQAGEL